MRVEDKYTGKEVFAKQCRDTTWEYFEPRIANCEHRAWLQKAVRVEAESESRKDRIIEINKRVQEL